MLRHFFFEEFFGVGVKRDDGVLASFEDDVPNVVLNAVCFVS